LGLKPMAGRKFYVVWAGRKPGVYETWQDCSLQVNGFGGAQYKAFASREKAEKALAEGASAHLHLSTLKEPAAPRPLPGPDSLPEIPSYCVDASCPGNPGPVEYRGVETESRREVFHIGPFSGGSNNIGEFLALVHALAWMKQRGETLPVYTDSRTAAAWVRAKTCKTRLARVDKNRQLFEMVSRAETWLAQNDYPNRILTWNTRAWGEIPADFGRK